MGGSLTEDIVTSGVFALCLYYQGMYVHSTWPDTLSSEGIHHV